MGSPVYSNQSTKLLHLTLVCEQLACLILSSELGTIIWMPFCLCLENYFASIFALTDSLKQSIMMHGYKLVVDKRQMQYMVAPTQNTYLRVLARDSLTFQFDLHAKLMKIIRIAFVLWYKVMSSLRK